MPTPDRFKRHVYRRVIPGKGNTGRGEMLPFDHLADGRWRHVRPTIDFEATQIGFKSALYSFARRWEAPCQVRMHHDGTVTFRLGPLAEAVQAIRAKKYTPIMWPPKREWTTLRFVAGPGTRDDPEEFDGRPRPGEDPVSLYRLPPGERILLPHS